MLRAPLDCRRNVQNASAKRPTRVGETSQDQKVCRRNVCRRNVRTPRITSASMHICVIQSSDINVKACDSLYRTITKFLFFAVLDDEIDDLYTTVKLSAVLSI